MQRSDLVTFIGIALGPFLLLGAAAFMGWLYKRSLLKRMQGGQRPPDDDADAANGGPHREPISAADAAAIPLDSAAAQMRDDALRVTRGVRFSLIAASLLYSLVVTAVNMLFVNQLFTERVAISYALLAPQILIVMWSIRVPHRWRWPLFLIYFIISVPIVLREQKAVLIYAVLLFAFIPLGGLFLLFVRRQQPFFILILATVGIFVGLSTVYDRYNPGSATKYLQLVLANPWLLTPALLGILIGVAITFALPRLPWLLRVVAILAIVIVFVLLERQLTQSTLSPSSQVLYFLVRSMFDVCLLWMVFKIFVWLQGRRFLTNELIHIHLCWAALTFFLLLMAVYPEVYRDPSPARWGFLLAFLLHAALLHTLLFIDRHEKRTLPEFRLLFLRVFGSADKRETLLDDLNDTWRRIAPLDLIAATDVASRTVGSAMLEAFVLRRSDSQFVTNESKLAERLAMQRSTLDADARYAMNPYYCYAQVWEEVFRRLARPSNVIALMDVRGFDKTHTSVAFELKHLIRTKPLDQIILVADRTTKTDALDDVLRKVPVTGPITVLELGRNARKNRRALFALLLKAATSTRKTASEHFPATPDLR